MSYVIITIINIIKFHFTLSKHARFNLVPEKKNNNFESLRRKSKLQFSKSCLNSRTLKHYKNFGTYDFRMINTLIDIASSMMMRWIVEIYFCVSIYPFPFHSLSRLVL